jgi:hypothetical protein
VEGFARRGEGGGLRDHRDNGAAFAVFLDVQDHDELMMVLFSNPTGNWGDYQVFPLGTLEGEMKAMRAAGMIDG